MKAVSLFSAVTITFLRCVALKHTRIAARLAVLGILLLLSAPAEALSIKKNAQEKLPAESSQFRNALTDLSLTRTGTEEALAPEQISLAYMPRDYDEGEKHVSTYHGKHVTAIVFLSIAAIALLIALSFVKAAKDSSNAAGVFFGLVACTGLFLGFGIPGTILMFRYPHNRPNVKA